MRSFSINLPADTDRHCLYDLMLDESNAVPTDGILPDRVQELTILFNGTITLSDRNDTGGMEYLSGYTLTKRSSVNSICLRDFFLAGDAGSENFVVEITYL